MWRENLTHPRRSPNAGGLWRAPMRKVDLIKTIYVEKALQDGPVARHVYEHAPEDVKI